jgi:hypothetical protein
MEGFVKAGFKKDPSNYYKVPKENKMTGQEIQELIFGKTMEGIKYDMPWSLITNKNGVSEYTLFFNFYKGKSWVEGDTLCRQFPLLYDGLKYCSEIYKNPEGDSATYSEYLLLTDFWLLPFSVK